MLIVFNIQRYSLHDGNGIRTNVFFKGCPLHCLWCNNPESIDPTPAIMFDARLCHKFGDCISASNGRIALKNETLNIERENITDFESLRDICPSNALTLAGKAMTTGEIIKEIEKDTSFYKTSGGGVTLSGGEPFSQDPYLLDLVREIKAREIHISVETTLNMPWETIEKYTGFIDVFLADLKHLDKEKLTNFTGGNALLILSNLRRLDDEGSQIVVRVPVIPGFNHSFPEMKEIIDFASSLKNAREINFIPFHSLAREKYEMLGKQYFYENQRNVEKEELSQYVDYAMKQGLITKILN